MKHYIITKFIPEITAEDKDRIACEVEELFAPVLSIGGIWGVKVMKNCIDRPNRYDLMIEITMEKEALEAYDNCEAHHLWKQKYGPLLAQKAIFDCE